MKITLRIAGKAHGQARPRFNPATGHVHKPPANSVSEADIRQIWREAGEPRIEGKPGLRVILIIKVPRPNGHFKKDGTLSTEGVRHPRPDNKKPDTDNAIKTIMDALNGRAYHDDVQVVEHVVIRDWADWPEQIVVIEPTQEYAKLNEPPQGPGPDPGDEAEDQHQDAGSQASSA